MIALEGEVVAPRQLALEDLSRAPEQVPDVSTLVPGRSGRGVWMRAVVAGAAKPAARYATLASADGRFAISVPLAPLLERALLVYGQGDDPLPESKGGPVRVLLVDAPACKTAEVDACASVKGLARIRLTSEREPDIGHSHS